MKLNKLTKSISIELTDIDDESRVIKGYGSVFGNVDSDNDVIKAGAYKRTIKNRGPEGSDRIAFCAQHDLSRPIGSITKMYEDEKGLYFEAKFGTHTDGEDYYRMSKEGIIKEFSVGFVPMKYDKNEIGGIDIDEIKLYEISLVTVASNELAKVTEVKAEEIADEIVEKVATLDKEKAFEVEALLLKMAEAFNIQSTQLAEEAPVSEVKEEANDLESLHKAFFNN